MGDRNGHQFHKDHRIMVMDLMIENNVPGEKGCLYLLGRDTGVEGIGRGRTFPSVVSRRITT